MKVPSIADDILLSNGFIRERVGDKVYLYKPPFDTRTIIVMDYKNESYKGYGMSNLYLDLVHKIFNKE